MSQNKVAPPPKKNTNSPCQVLSIHTENENAVYHLHFVNEMAKVNSAYYLEQLLSKLVEDFKQLLLNGFVFHQDGTPAYTACITQDWLTELLWLPYYGRP